MLKRLKQAWKRDRLGVLGVVTAVAGFAFWAWPSRFCLRNEWVLEPWPGTYRCLEYQIDAFRLERLPVAGAFFTLAVSLLVFRRRKAAGVFVRRLMQAWKRDRLGVLGIASAVVAFLFWAFPVRGFTFCNWSTKWVDGKSYQEFLGCKFNAKGFFDDLSGVSETIYLSWFTIERLPVVISFLVLGAFLLLLRRR
jgi:hypothetical protein